MFPPCLSFLVASKVSLVTPSSLQETTGTLVGTFFFRKHVEQVLTDAAVPILHRSGSRFPTQDPIINKRICFYDTERRVGWLTVDPEYCLRRRRVMTLVWRCAYRQTRVARICARGSRTECRCCACKWKSVVNICVHCARRVIEYQAAAAPMEQSQSQAHGSYWDNKRMRQPC